MGFKDIGIKVMDHFFGKLFEVKPIHVHVKQVDLPEEQNRCVVHDDTDDLVNIISFLVL